jgi:hypothetical protein
MHASDAVCVAFPRSLEIDRSLMPVNVLSTGPLMVREGRSRHRVPGNRYEDEGSERSAIGSTSVSVDSHWRATLTVPLPHADAVFLRLERKGPLPDGYRGAEESAGFSVPVTELGAVMEALAGVIAQARRDGVLE